jgi:hypothetical protein
MSAAAELAGLRLLEMQELPESPGSLDSWRPGGQLPAADAARCGPASRAAVALHPLSFSSPSWSQGFPALAFGRQRVSQKILVLAPVHWPASPGIQASLAVRLSLWTAILALPVVYWREWMPRDSPMLELGSLRSLAVELRSAYQADARGSSPKPPASPQTVQASVAELCAIRPDAPWPASAELRRARWRSHQGRPFSPVRPGPPL